MKKTISLTLALLGASLSQAGPVRPATVVPWSSVPSPSARFRNRQQPLWRSWGWEACWQGAADIDVCFVLISFPAKSRKGARRSCFFPAPRFIKRACFFHLLKLSFFSVFSTSLMRIRDLIRRVTGCGTHLLPLQRIFSGLNFLCFSCD